MLSLAEHAAAPKQPRCSAGVAPIYRSMEQKKKKKDMKRLETDYADITGINYSDVSMEFCCRRHNELKHLQAIDPHPALSNGLMVPDSSLF